MNKKCFGLSGIRIITETCIALSLLCISFSSFAFGQVICPSAEILNPFINNPFPNFPTGTIGPMRLQGGNGKGNIILYG